ncbi:MAG: hypothetical protein OCD00_05630 [Colwellia sp.]
MQKERRHVQAKIQQLLKELTVAQQCSLSEISNFGYSLSFVRTTSDGKLAVVKLDNGAITVDDQGEIDHNPQITIRE